MIEEMPYSSSYREGIIHCLKRNFDWMKGENNEHINNWFEPIVNHNWKGSKESIGYPYGKVLLSEGNVIGFLGCINAIRLIEGNRVYASNLTTWAVDEGARGLFIPYTQDLYEEPDIVLDLTPDKASVIMGRKLYGMKLYDEMLFRFPPILYLGKRRLDIVSVDGETQIDDDQIKKELDDHSSFDDIKLVHINDGNSDCFVFYKVFRRTGEWIRILKVTNRRLFTINLHEIVWEIFDREFYHKYRSFNSKNSAILNNKRSGKWICAECDSRFVDIEYLDYPGLMSKKITRLVRDNIGINLDYIDHLYTEYAVLI